MFWGDPPGDLDAEDPPERDTHGSVMTTQGTLVVTILEDDQITSPISWDSTAQVYNLSYPAERLRVIIKATGLESNRTFEINWQMFGIIGEDTSPAALQDASGGYDLYSGRITHSTISGQTDFVSSVLPTQSLGSGIPMNDQVPSSKRGCYWIAATISDQDPHAVEVMPSVVSESVRYGQSCPDEVQPGILRLDSDGDGWTDELEYACGTNPFDPDIGPTLSRMGGLTCIELGDDDGDGVRNIDDVCPGENASVDSTGCTTPSPWDDSDDDNYDDSSFLAGCIAGGGSISAADECIPSQWDDSDDDDWDDDSYDAGVASVNITSDNPVCDWTTHTWSPTADPQCVPISPCPDSTGCTTQCPKCADDTSNPESGSEDDINLTGSGDAADLVMVGGAAIVGGIGITTILSQFSGRNRGIRGSRSPQIELELELPSDSEPNFVVICADCGKDVESIIKGQKSKRIPAGGVWTCCPECGTGDPSKGRLLMRDARK